MVNVPCRAEGECPRGLKGVLAGRLTRVLNGVTARGLLWRLGVGKVEGAVAGHDQLRRVRVAAAVGDVRPCAEGAATVARRGEVDVRRGVLSDGPREVDRSISLDRKGGPTGRCRGIPRRRAPSCRRSPRRPRIDGIGARPRTRSKRHGCRHWRRPRGPSCRCARGRQRGVPCRHPRTSVRGSLGNRTFGRRRSSEQRRSHLRASHRRRRASAKRHTPGPARLPVWTLAATRRRRPGSSTRSPVRRRWPRRPDRRPGGPRPGRPGSPRPRRPGRGRRWPPTDRRRSGTPSCSSAKDLARRAPWRRRSARSRSALPTQRPRRCRSRSIRCDAGWLSEHASIGPTASVPSNTKTSRCTTVPSPTHLTATSSRSSPHQRSVGAAPRRLPWALPSFGDRHDHRPGDQRGPYEPLVDPREERFVQHRAEQGQRERQDGKQRIGPTSPWASAPGAHQRPPNRRDDDRRRRNSRRPPVDPIVRVVGCVEPVQRGQHHGEGRDEECGRYESRPPRRAGQEYGVRATALAAVIAKAVSISQP